MEKNESLLNSFDQKWTQFVEAKFNDMCNKGYCHIETHSQESLSHDLGKIKNDVFKIAIVGTVKAGKSSLLNALLFGRQVLPTSEIPQTAKLTFIEYTNKNNPHAKIEFFNQEEFENYKKAFSKREYKQEVEDAEKRLEREEGKTCDDFGIKKELNNITNMSELEEYIGAKGKYVHFVKQATIYLNDEILKGIQIIDTPGLDDPNIFRSEITQKYTREVHAMVIVTGVKGPCASDRKFINNLNRDASSYVMVINKIDTNEEYNVVKERIENEKEIWGEIPVCCYSAKRALEAMITAGKYKKLVYDPDNLKEVIAQKLCNNQGQTRLDSALALLKIVIDLHVKEKAQQITILTQKIDLFGKNEKDVQSMINDLEKKIKLFENQEMKFGDEIKDIKTDTLNDLKGMLSDLENTVIKKIRQINATDETQFNNELRERWGDIDYSKRTEIITDLKSKLRYRSETLVKDINNFCAENEISDIVVDEIVKSINIEYTNYNIALPEYGFWARRWYSPNEILNDYHKTAIAYISSFYEKECVERYQTSIEEHINNIKTQNLEPIVSHLETLLNGLKTHVNTHLTTQQELNDVKEKLDLIKQEYEILQTYKKEIVKEA